MAINNSFFSTWAPRVLSILRIVAGFLLLAHGMQKILGFPPSPQPPGGPVPFYISLAGWLELVGGALLILGLFTRPTAFILSGLMAVAYFMAHAPQGFWPILNRGELAALYSFVFLYLAVAGGGEWSLDRIFRRVS